MAPRITYRLGALVATSLLVLGFSTSGAAAKPLVKERYTDTYTFSYDDCGFLVEGEGTASGVFMLKKGKKGDPTPSILDNFEFLEVQTNPANGKWFTLGGNGLYKEAPIVNVTGTVYTFEAFYAGQPFVLRDMDGNVVIKDRGNLRITFALDTLGDSDIDNDVFIDGSFAVLRDAGAHPGFYVEWCDLVTDLIG